MEAYTAEYIAMGMPDAHLARTLIIGATEQPISQADRLAAQSDESSVEDRQSCGPAQST